MSGQRFLMKKNTGLPPWLIGISLSLCSLSIGLFLDGTIAAAWAKDGTYGILKDLGGLIGAVIGSAAALSAGWMAWRGIQAQISDSNTKSIEELVTKLSIVIAYCKAVAEAARLIQDSLSPLIDPEPEPKEMNAKPAADAVALAVQNRDWIMEKCNKLDVTPIIGSMPVSLWLRIRGCMRLEDLIDDCLEQARDAVYDREKITVPIKDAELITEYLNFIRNDMGRAAREIVQITNQLLKQYPRAFAYDSAFDLSKWHAAEARAASDRAR